MKKQKAEIGGPVITRSDTGAVVVRGRHYTLGEVARGSGITRPHVTRIFNGKRGLSLASAQRISAFLGVPLEAVVSLLSQGQRQ